MASFDSNVAALLGSVENFVSSKTVVGEAIHIGDTIIVPLVDVSFGLGTGTNNSVEKRGETGVGGLGASITPSAVLVIANGAVQLVNIKNQDSLNKLIDMAPGVLAKVSSFFNKKKDDAESSEDDKMAPKEEL